MKAQSDFQGQDERRWQDLAFEIWLDTPEGQKWLEIERVSEDAKFYDWLNSPDGIDFINAEAEAHIDQGQLFWNFDGFNSVLPFTTPNYEESISNN